MLHDDLLNALGNVAHFLVLPVFSKYLGRPRGSAISGSYT
jgi:hypothetical protein